MTAEDMAILDRIERLAFQAGLASGNGQTKSLPTEAETILRKLAKMGRTYPNNIGSALYGLAAEDNVTWEEIVALGKVM